MKQIHLLFLIFSFYTLTNTFCQEKKTPKLIFGFSNKFFNENNKEYNFNKNVYSFAPFIGYAINKKISLELEFEKFKYDRFSDYSIIFDASSFVIDKETKILLLPFSIKYEHQLGSKFNPYMKISGIFRTERKELTTYYYNEPSSKNENNSDDFMYGFGFGAIYHLCNNSNLSFGGFYRKSKEHRISNIGLNVNLKILL